MPTIPCYSTEFFMVVGLYDGLYRLLRQRAPMSKVKAGNLLACPDGDVETHLFLLSGTVLMRQKGNAGGDIFWRTPEQALDCAAVVPLAPATIEVFAVTDLCAFEVSDGLLRRLMAVSTELRGFLFRSYMRRMVDLCAMIELANPLRDVTGHRPDERVLH